MSDRKIAKACGVSLMRYARGNPANAGIDPGGVIESPRPVRLPRARRDTPCSHTRDLTNS
jgi:hypothetical protein